MPKIFSEEQELLIDLLTPKGRGYCSEKKIEVAGALPQETVVVEPGGRGKGFLRKILVSSPERVTPQCPHVPLCGGCSLQQMDYSAQLQLKEKLVKELFAPFSVPLHPIIGSDPPWEYRNKMEFSFSENKQGDKFLGLIIGGSKGHVLNLSECHLVSKWFLETLQAVRKWWEESPLKAYQHRNNFGHLRTLTLREAQKGEGKMVILTVSGDPSFAIKKQWLDRFVETVRGEKVSVFVQVHQIAKGRPSQFFEMLLDGPDHITEVLDISLLGKMHRMEFKISPTSFFQPNTRQAEKLSSAALGAVSNLTGALVFDLYCGGATLGLTAAHYAKEVVGIELNPHSLFDAGWNQEVNGIKNFNGIRGDVGEVLSTLNKRADLIIVDPPRAGLDVKALNEILRANPKEILYISCNPKTQVENLALLVEKGGYHLSFLQPVDQFPHTMHIENIALLQKA